VSPVSVEKGPGFEPRSIRYDLVYALAGGDDIGFYVVATAPTGAKLNTCRDHITAAVRVIFAA
jgi:hypothetical protein